MASFDSQALCNWCYICLTYFQVHDSEGLLTEYRNTPPPLIHFKLCLRKTHNRNPLFACNCKSRLLKISLTTLPYLVCCAIAGYFMRLFEIKFGVKLTWINVIFRGKRFYNVPVASYGNKIKLPGPLSLSGVHFALNPSGSSGWKAHRRVGSCGSFGLGPPKVLL